MFARQMQSLVLASCFWRASAFAAIVGTAATMTAPRSADANSLAMSTPRSPDNRPNFAKILQRARGGQLIRRRAASVSQEASGQQTQKLVVDAEPADQGLLAAYLRALKNKPMTTKVITSGVICGAGDILAQALTFKKSPVSGNWVKSFAQSFEFQRFGIYGILGALYIAPLVHYWFNGLENVTASPQGPPKTTGGRLGKALKMVTLDQLIGAPVVNAGFMFLFTYLSALASGGNLSPAFEKASNMVRASIVSTMLVCWKIWPFANFVNFLFVPADLRVLFMNLIGLGWNIFLSFAVN